jgi:Caspase domain
VRLPDPSTSWAVLVGVADYPHDPGLNSLPAVHNNLDALRDVLTDPRLCGIPAEQCVVLKDPKTERDLLMGIADNASRATDMFLVYYAGHGLLDDLGQFYLGVGVSTRHAADLDSLSYERVKAALRRSHAAAKVLILDCCFSGRAIEVMAEPATLVRGQVEITGVYTMTATSGTKPAYAPEGAPFTAFTGELVEVLTSGIPGEPENLSLQTIYVQVRQTMSAAGLPKPEQRGTNTAANLALVRNVAFSPSISRSSQPMDISVRPTVRLKVDNPLPVNGYVRGTGFGAAAGELTMLVEVEPDSQHGPQDRPSLLALLRDRIRADDERPVVPRLVSWLPGRREPRLDLTISGPSVRPRAELVTSPDGRYCLTSADPGATLWDLRSADRIGMIGDRISRIGRFAFSTDSRTIVELHYDYSNLTDEIRIYESSTGRLTDSFPLILELSRLWAEVFRPISQLVI